MSIIFYQRPLLTLFTILFRTFIITMLPEKEIVLKTSETIAGGQAEDGQIYIDMLLLIALWGLIVNLDRRRIFILILAVHKYIQLQNMKLWLWSMLMSKHLKYEIVFDSPNRLSLLQIRCLPFGMICCRFFSRNIPNINGSWMANFDWTQWLWNQFIRNQIMWRMHKTNDSHSNLLCNSIHFWK